MTFQTRRACYKSQVGKGKMYKFSTFVLEASAGCSK